MPLSADAIRTTMQAFRESDPTGYWRPCLDAVETYLVAQEEREGGMLLPTDIAEWMTSSQPTRHAIQFALWALSGDFIPGRIPDLQAPSSPQELWGWVDLYRRRPDWRMRFAALGEREPGWRPVLSNWSALERLASEWPMTAAGPRRDSILREALHLMGLPEPTPTRLELLPPPPMTREAGGARFSLTRPEDRNVATIAPHDAESIGRAMVRHLESTMLAHVSNMEERIIGHMIGALEQREAAVREELVAMSETERRRLDALLANSQEEVTKAVDKRLRAMGLHEPAFGAHFPQD